MDWSRRGVILAVSLAVLGSAAATTGTAAFFIARARNLLAHMETVQPGMPRAQVLAEVRALGAPVREAADSDSVRLEWSFSHRFPDHLEHRFDPQGRVTESRLINGDFEVAGAKAMDFAARFCRVSWVLVALDLLFCLAAAGGLTLPLLGLLRALSARLKQRAVLSGLVLLAVALSLAAVSRVPLAVSLLCTQ